METVVAFLLLIAPGYVWQSRAAKHLPESTTTTLREAARIVFSSIIPSTLATALVLTVVSGWPPSLPARLGSFDIVLIGLVISALACAFAYFWPLIWFRRERKWASQISGGSALFKALTQFPENPAATHVIVTARLKDGTVWRGRHEAHDVESEESFRTLFLAPPLTRRNATTGKAFEYGKADYVLLPLDHVSSLQLKYLSAPREVEDTTST